MDASKGLRGGLMRTRGGLAPTRTIVARTRMIFTRSRVIFTRPRVIFTRPRVIFTRLRYGLRAVLDMFYGATIYEMVRDLNKERSRLEHMFVLVVFGDLLGIPILPPYYTLKLLPYVMPLIPGWRTSLLRERDLTDLCDQEIT